MWRATDGDTVIWLFGTIHLLPPGERWQQGAVATAIAESGTLITEIPEGEPQAQAAAFLKLARADGLPPIRDRVPPDQQTALTAAIAAAGATEASLDRMQSWGAALVLSGGLARAVGGTREAAPEAVLAAAFKGRQHEAFESFAGQLGVFAALPEAAQRRLLAESIRAGGDPAAEFQTLLGAWRTGDPAALEHAFNDAFADAPDLRAALLTDRNRAWADDLSRRAAKPGTLFVAVGAGHMVGSKGLPALLSESGFRVARVQ